MVMFKKSSTIVFSKVFVCMKKLQANPEPNFLGNGLYIDGFQILSAQLEWWRNAPWWKRFWCYI